MVNALGGDMTAQSKETKSTQENSDLTSAGNVDQIRDIIFGSQMRDYESRFQRLEERLLSELSSVRKEVNNRVETLETYMQSEIGALNDRLASERDERESEDKVLEDEIKKLSKELLRKLAHLDESVAKQNRDLRQQLLDQSKNLSSDIEATREQLNGALTRSSDELRNSKTDRVALAELFSEVSLRLKDEFPIPAGK